MMNKLILLLSLVFIFSCNKEPIESLNLQWKPIKISTIKNTFEPRNGPVSEKTTSFEYNEEDQLTRVIDLNEEEWTFIYDEDGKLLTINRFHSNNALISKDTFIYASEIKIDEVHHYQVNYTNQLLELHSVLKYKYDNLNQIVQVDTDYLIWDTNSKVKYFWSKGNIVEAKSWSDGELSSGTKFKYDDKPNYKNNNPYFFLLSGSWSKNNSIESDLTEYESTIAIEYYCYICKTKYNYKDGRPSKAEYEWNSTDEISYFD